MSNWYGVLPERWESHRIKTIFGLRDERNFLPLSEVNLLSLYTAIGVKPHSQIERVAGNVAVTADNYKKVYKDDIVVNIILCWQGAIGVSKWDGVTSPAYDVYKAKSNDVNADYYHYLFRIPYFSGECYKAGHGIMAMRWRTYSDEFGAIPVPLPPRTEQDQIVRYLDWKVSQINRLINAKRRQIGLLQEQKRAIINAAVTRGGDGWREHQLAKIAVITLSGLDKKSYEGQTPVLLCNYVDVYKKDNITSALDFMKATASEAEKANLKLHLDDVVITKDSESWDDIGVPAYVAEEIDDLYCGYHLAIIRTNKEVLNGEYLAFAFQSQYIQIQHKVKAKGVTRFALGYQPIHDTTVLVPPLDEQLAIVQEIKAHCQTQDICIINIKDQIALLTEYCTRLISDVVTGKLDVRGMAVPDFEVVEETAGNESTEDEDIAEGDGE